MKRLLFLAAVVLSSSAAYADGAKNIAIFELRVGPTNMDAQTVAMRQRLVTAWVREVASNLPREKYSAMTRESILARLPPEDLAKCESSAQCQVDFARRVDADFSIGGEFFASEESMSASFELYETETSKMLSAKTVKGRDMEDLETNVKRGVARMLVTLPGGEVLKKLYPIDEVQSFDVKGGKIGGGEEAWNVDTNQGGAIVKFQSNPPGAVVFAAGKMLCQATPCSKTLPFGRVQIRMVRERYEERVEEIEVRKTTISWDLVPNFGAIDIDSEPSGLDIRIDGDPRGKTPLRGVELALGGYEIVVDSPCYYSSGERVSIKRGAKQKLVLKPTAKEGLVEASAHDKDGNDLEAEVFIDGKRVGETPARVKVNMCAKRIELKAQGFRTHAEDLAVREKSKTVVKATLVAGNDGATDTPPAGEGPTEVAVVAKSTKPMLFFTGPAGEKAFRFQIGAGIYYLPETRLKAKTPDNTIIRKAAGAFAVNMDLVIERFLWIGANVHVVFEGGSIVGGGIVGARLPLAYVAISVGTGLSVNEGPTIVNEGATQKFQRAAGLSMPLVAKIDIYPFSSMFIEIRGGFIFNLINAENAGFFGGGLGYAF